MPLKLSIGTPVVTMDPKAHAPWEETASIEDVARIAEAADRLGYHHLTCSEHVALPAAELARRGSRYWDPLATFGYLAARTTRIRFTTLVLVLGYHHPLDIAKRYGTLDKVSNGRLILGVGVGTLREEFDLLGAPFAPARSTGRRRSPCAPCVVVAPAACVPRGVLRLRRLHRRPVRHARPSAAVGRWPQPSLASKSGNPGRWLVSVRGGSCPSC